MKNLYSGHCVKCGRPIWRTDREGFAVFLPRSLDPRGFPYHPSCLVGEEVRLLAKWQREAAQGNEDAAYCLAQYRRLEGR